MNGTVVGTIAVAQGDIDTRTILHLEIANQESAAFLESDHGSWIESLLVVATRTWYFIMRHDVGYLCCLS